MFGPDGLAATLAARERGARAQHGVAHAGPADRASRRANGLRVLDAPVSGGALTGLDGRADDHGRRRCGGSCRCRSTLAVDALESCRPPRRGRRRLAGEAHQQHPLLRADRPRGRRDEGGGVARGRPRRASLRSCMTSSSACVASGVRLRAGSLAGVAESPAGPTLTEGRRIAGRGARRRSWRTSLSRSPSASSPGCNRVTRSGVEGPIDSGSSTRPSSGSRRSSSCIWRPTSAAAASPSCSSRARTTRTATSPSRCEMMLRFDVA